MAKEIKCFKDFLAELAVATDNFTLLSYGDKKMILNYILENSFF